MSKEEFEKAIKSAEKQSSYFRAEQVALRAALEELERMRDGREVDENLYDELHQRYYQRLNEINEKAEQYRSITQSLKHLVRYEKELDLLKESQEELVDRLEKTEDKVNQERTRVEAMAEKFGVPFAPYPIKAAEEKRTVSAPSQEEATEAESEIERLRQEILSELEKTRRQTK